jgi:hypothetical protein
VNFPRNGSERRRANTQEDLVSKAMTSALYKKARIKRAYARSFAYQHHLRRCGGAVARPRDAASAKGAAARNLVELRFALVFFSAARFTVRFIGFSLVVTRAEILF